ncbi:LamG domain-containing protein, partial [Patescibacteria group bacterium]
MKSQSKKFNTLTKLSILVALVAVPIFSYFIFDTFAGAIIGKTLKTNSTLENGLVVHWTFDGPDMLSNVADTSGQGNNGSLIGQTSTTTVEGKVGQALEFDGVDDFVFETGVNLSNTNKISISFWMKKDSFPNSTKLAFELTTNTNSYTTGLFIDPTSSGSCSGYLDLTLKGDVGTNSGCFSRPSAGVWHHYVAVFDKSQPANEVDLYIDGLSQTAAARYFTSDNTNNFGNVPLYTMSRAGSSLFQSGQLDDIRIYDRVLSADEITQLYNQTKGNVANKTVGSSGLESGLVGHWTFDGPDMLSNVADTSGQGNNGSLIGQTSTTTVEGKVGQALEFDGSDDYVDVADNSIFDVGAGLTMAAWVKLDDVELDHRYFIEMTPLKALIRVRGTNDKYNVYLGSDCDSTTNADYGGDWHFIVGTYDGTNAKIYVDSVLENTCGGQSDVSGVSGINIGRYNGDLYHVDGTIDDVRIYNRALSADEITQLYNQTKGNVANKT